MVDDLYKNIGGKIKKWAKWTFIIEAVGAVIAGLSMICIAEDLVVYGLLVIILGAFIAWLSTLILYAFGQFVEDTHALRKKICGYEETEKIASEKKAKSEAVVDMRKQTIGLQGQKSDQPKFNPEENGHISTVGNVPNISFSPCIRSEYLSRLPQNDNEEILDEDFIDVICPKCKEKLSFLKGKTDTVCPWCNTKIDL